MTSILRCALSVVSEVCRVMEKDAERHERLFGGLQFIQQEMDMVDAFLKDKYRPQGAVQERWVCQLQELAYNVEDLVESLWLPGAYGKILVAIGMDRRDQRLIRVDQFKETIKSLKEWKQSTESSDVEDKDDNDEDEEEDLEGIDGPKGEILKLLSPSPGEKQQLRVISIVGCRGVGKTALAKAIYNDYKQSTSSQKPSHAFDCVAWVMASGCNNKNDLIGNIRQAIASTSPAKAKGSLMDILSKNRCLVFIDDVQQKQVWKDTVDDFLKYDSESRIIVTTSVISVAKACSSGSNVYTMKRLKDDCVKSLFWRKVYPDGRTPPTSVADDPETEAIFEICGGSPLPLTCAAKYLNGKGDDLASCHCKEARQELGRYPSDNNAAIEFKRMRRVLMQCYDSLPDYDDRSVFLYLSIFPRGHHLKRESLVRRLKAEAFVNIEPSKCFDELIDRCIIEPVQTRDNSVANKCQVHGVVLEYIIQKSKTKNMVTLVQGQEPQGRPRPAACVRRLSVQSSTNDRFDDIRCKSSLRSLTMFNSELSDLRCYKMLRLLHLDGCTELDNIFLEGLCELTLLRYLSLRRTGINELPEKIKELHCLETLDIRDTKVQKLPKEVIMLPKLAYLFGKFQLPDVTKTLSDFLKRKSLLHTLSGFVVTNKQRGLEHDILSARNLKKVKVWCNDTSVRKHASSRKFGSNSSSTGNNTNFVSLLTSSKPLESLSIVSTGLCKDFLASGPCTVSSIKLRGNLYSLPDPKRLSELTHIKKLQLFSTGLKIEELSSLQYLRGLEYLKLVEHNKPSGVSCHRTFIVEKNGFESLKSLCIDAPMVRLKFKEEAMRSLTSLLLVCRCSIAGCSRNPSQTIEGILHLTRLSELIIGSTMHQDWEAVADGHPNRPCVKRQQEPN